MIFWTQKVSTDWRSKALGSRDFFMQVLTSNDSGICLSPIQPTKLTDHQQDTESIHSYRNSLDSEGSSSTLDPGAHIHQADRLKNPFQTSRPLSGSWSQLMDEDPWGPTQEAQQSSSLPDPSWTPLRTWNPSTSNWSLSRFRFVPFENGSKPKWYTKNCCMRTIAIFIFLCVLISTLTVWQLHVSDGRFNGQLGPRGAAPESAPRGPLPVRGVTVPGNYSQLIYFGAAIDWVFYFHIAYR